MFEQSRLLDRRPKGDLLSIPSFELTKNKIDQTRIWTHAEYSMRIN